MLCQSWCRVLRALALEAFIALAIACGPPIGAPRADVVDTASSMSTALRTGAAGWACGGHARGAGTEHAKAYLQF